MLKFVLVCSNISPVKLEVEMLDCLFKYIKCYPTRTDNSVKFEFVQPLMTANSALTILNSVQNWLSVRHVDASIHDFSFE